MRLRALLVTIALLAATWLTAAAHTSISNRRTLDAVFARIPAAAEIPFDYLATPTGLIVVQAGPAPDIAPVATIDPGRPVIVTGQTEVSRGVVWREVITDSGLGWVDGRHLQDFDTLSPGGEDR